MESLDLSYRCENRCNFITISNILLLMFRESATFLVSAPIWVLDPLNDDCKELSQDTRVEIRETLVLARLVMIFPQSLKPELQEG